MLMNLVNYFNTHVKARFDNEKGQGMVEYGLIIAVVAIVAVVGFKLLGGNLNTIINNVAGELATTP